MTILCKLHGQKLIHYENLYSRLFSENLVTQNRKKKHWSKTVRTMFCTGANSRLDIYSASGSRSDKSNQWHRWSEFFRSAISAPIDQPPAVLVNGFFFQINLILYGADKIIRRLFAPYGRPHILTFRKSGCERSW
jgi:hypothetical protein